MPCNDFLPEHEYGSKQKHQRTDLAQRTAHCAKKHLLKRWKLFQHTGIAGGNGSLHQAKRRCRRCGISISHILLDFGPACHLNGETDEQEDTAGKRRIERVASQTAKGHLSNSDSNQCTDDDNPNGKITGKVESEQHSGEYGATVCNGDTFAF